MSELNNEGAIVKGFADALEDHKKSITEKLNNYSTGEDFEALKKSMSEENEKMMDTMKEMQSELVKTKNSLASKKNEGETELRKSIIDFAGDSTPGAKLYKGEKLITKAVETITIANQLPCRS